MTGCREGGKTNGTPTPYPKVENSTAAEDLWYIVEDGEVKIAGCNSLDDGCTGLKRVVLPSKVTELPQGLFSGCSNNLIEVVIPEGVTKLGQCVFGYCTELTNVTVPKSVTEIGYGAFTDCNNLTLTITAGSYAETYAKENNIPYVVK